MIPLVGVLLGEAPTAAKAALMANRYRQCPYCVSFASADVTVVAVYAIPPDHRWWLEWVEKQPQETLGLERAEVFFAQQVRASSPWSRGDVEAKLERGPCGADCQDCSHYHKECTGCPATQHFVSTDGKVKGV